MLIVEKCKKNVLWVKQMNFNSAWLNECKATIKENQDEIQVSR